MASEGALKAAREINSKQSYHMGGPLSVAYVAEIIDRCMAPAPSPGVTSEQAVCGKATKYYLLGEASSYACMLDMGHDGGCQPGGVCIKHGKYVGLTNGSVQCPKWPDCIVPLPSWPENEQARRRMILPSTKEIHDWCPDCRGAGCVEVPVVEPARDYDFHGNPPNLPARPELDKDEEGSA